LFGTLLWFTAYWSLMLWSFSWGWTQWYINLSFTVLLIMRWPLEGPWEGNHSLASWIGFFVCMYEKATGFIFSSNNKIPTFSYVTFILGQDLVHHAGDWCYLCVSVCLCVCVLAIFFVENVELWCYAHHMHLPKNIRDLWWVCTKILWTHIQDSPHKKY
jgi:hypothetical protein